MPNILELLRLKSLFNPAEMNPPNAGGGFAESFPQKNPYGDIFQNNPKVGVPPAPGMNLSMPNRGPVTDIPVESGMPMGRPNYDVSGRMSQIYKPETDANDRFSGLIDNMPRMEKPGVWRSLAAALSSFGPGGHETGMRVARQPYEDKMREWKSQIEPAHQAASLERHSNVNERTLAYQTVSQELRQEAQEAKEKNDERKASISEHRASVYEFKARNPDKKLVITKGGNVMVMDPRTGKMEDTGIPSGSMSRIDELNLMNDNAVERIEATGDQNRKTVAARGGIQKELERLRGEEARKTKATPGTAGSGAGSTEYQQKVGLQNKTAQVLAQNPEWEDHITFDENGFPQITPPSNSWYGSGPDKPTYDKIYESIYGTSRSTTIPARTGAKPPAATPPAKTPPAVTPSATTPPATAAAPPGTPWKQYSPSRDETRISVDGGKTWKIVKGRQ